MENPSSRILRSGAEKVPSKGVGQICRYTSRASMWRLEDWLFKEDVERGERRLELYQEGDGEGCPPGRTRERGVTYGEE